ncbi:hypothetical protein MNBD_NITROSPINAE02-1828 [hydrothermal vent metagenome]|uniref:Uncharacterized protein n=1 Tax=hydrothermal vent metagenome TaxID=652676 RepID=A0A3B1DAW6_9ZZZZ
MKKTRLMRLLRLVSFALLLVLSLPQVSWAAYHGMIHDGWGDTMTKGIANIANAQYDEGLVIFGEYIKAFPKEPAGYFFSAAAVKERMQKNNDLGDLDTFFKFADKVMAVCKNMLLQDVGNTVAKVYLGGMYGYLSMVEVKRGNLVSALFKGVDAKKNLEAARKEDPDIPDTYFGLGMLYYFASLKSKKAGGFTGWIISNFITHGKDMSQKGVELTQRAIDMGSVGSDFARGALIWMRLYQKEFAKAKNLAEKMAERFLRDTSSRWVLGRVALIDDDCASARKWFEDIDTIIKKYSTPGTEYPDVDNALKMVRLCELVNEKRWSEVRALKKEINAWLDGKPKVAIEYQEKENLIASWRKQITKYDDTEIKSISLR